MKQTKHIKKVMAVIFVLVIMQVLSFKVLAANLNLNIDFDGKTIEMLSETPEMKWQTKNIVPGKNYSTTIIINSIGSKEVKVEFATEITEGKEYEEYINMKIINSKSNETIYDGKYKDFQNVVEKISAKETKTYTVTISLPEETENKFENNVCTIKFNFTAKGEKNVITVANQTETLEQTQTQENAEEITTNSIKQIKTSQSYVIFIVLGILVIVLIVLIILFVKTRK